MNGKTPNPTNSDSPTQSFRRRVEGLGGAGPRTPLRRWSFHHVRLPAVRRCEGSAFSLEPCVLPLRHHQHVAPPGHRPPAEIHLTLVHQGGPQAGEWAVRGRLRGSV